MDSTASARAGQPADAGGRVRESELITTGVDGSRDSKDHLGGALDEFLGAAHGQRRVVNDGPLDSVELLTDSRGVVQVAKRGQGEPGPDGPDVACLLVDHVTVSSQRVEELAAVLRVEPVDEPLEDPQHSLDVGDIAPGDRCEVLLSKDASGAAVVVGAVRVRREALILEGGTNRTKGAVGHEVPEQPSGGTADQLAPAHAAPPRAASGAQAGRRPTVALSKCPYTVVRGTPKMSAIS